MSTADKQLELEFDDWRPIAEPPKVEGATIDERFASFHALNPHVYLAIVSAARALKREGRNHVAMKYIYEVLRRNSELSTRGDAWKLNNDYTALYARQVMAEHADLKGLFKTRVRTAKAAT